MHVHAWLDPWALQVLQVPRESLVQLALWALPVLLVQGESPAQPVREVSSTSCCRCCHPSASSSKQACLEVVSCKGARVSAATCRVVSVPFR